MLGVEQGEASVTTEGDEVVGAEILIALETRGHVGRVTAMFVRVSDVCRRSGLCLTPPLRPKEGLEGGAPTQCQR